MDAVNARDEFRWGVLAFYNGFYNEAILSFEKSLSYKPDDSQTHFWLGRAYYYSGFEEAALNEWSNIMEIGRGSGFLSNLIEIIQDRRGVARELKAERRYVVLNSFQGNHEEFTLFSRPSAVLTREDGTFYLVAFASNEILKINTNGRILGRYRGRLTGFHHPFDIVETEDNHLLVTEYDGDRVSKCTLEGDRVVTFGETGRGPGQMVGPQYIALDEDGNVYVTEFGNRRVSKFTSGGEFILSFGQKTFGYQGFRSPTGIAVMGDRVYVADSKHRHVAVFDLSGNFLAVLADNQLNAPEGMSVVDNTLLISDSSEIVVLDVDQDKVSPYSDFRGDAGRILNVAFDVNGNLLVTDFDKNQVTVLSEMSSIYSGYYVRIKRVVVDDYPNVTVYVNVQDRYGNPIIGLEKNNFNISEDSMPVDSVNLAFSGYLSDYANVTVLIDRQMSMAGFDENIKLAVNDIVSSFTMSNSVKIVGAGEIPVVLSDSNVGPATAASVAVSGTSLSDKAQFDLGLRLAASELIPGANKRAVVYVTNGELGNHAFDEYSMVELVQYLRNNDISFYTVYVGENRKNEELEYISRETGGESYYLYNPKGISHIASDIKRRKSGDYVLTYTSIQDTDFGRAYIPLEVEAFLVRKSGRDETGYFAPFSF